MAGTLPGIANTQRVDQQGKPLVGGKLYLFNAGTITPATAFKDFNLTEGQEHPFPIVLDEWGQIPPFYLNDGFYRARLTNASGGTVLFDMIQLPVVGNPEGGGGDTPEIVDPTAIFQTGMEFLWPFSGSRTGFVRGNGRTIGNASSGATERANNDCQALFEFYWNNFPDTIHPVVGGRGVSSTADWNAGKQITIPDFKGRVAIGANQMGSGSDGSNSDTSFSSPDSVGTAGGSSQVILITSNLPPYTPSGSITNGAITINHNAAVNAGGTTTGGGESELNSRGAATITATQAVSTFIGSAQGGTSAPINNVPPSVVRTLYIKL